MSTTPSTGQSCVDETEPIPFPVHRARMIFPPSSALRNEAVGDTAEEVLDALQNVSRRITDLARELGCLGYFDDHDNGRPRAA